MTYLFLFDIDGTLVNVNGLHCAAYQQAYKQILDVDLPRETLVSTFGMSEFDMHCRLLTHFSLECTSELVDRLGTSYRQAFLHSLRSQQLTPLEGVTDFLCWLQDNKHSIGIVTGGVKESAREILTQAGLHDFFSVFSYGDGHKPRERIVADAITQAGKRSFDSVVVIGDTRFDVAAGKTNDAFVVGVATGSHSVDDLSSTQADLVLPSLKEWRIIVDTLGLS